jgi:hypothetical protein
MTLSSFTQEHQMATFTHGLEIPALKLRKFMKVPLWVWHMLMASFFRLAQKITSSKSVKAANCSKKSKFKDMQSHWIYTMAHYLLQPSLVKF